MPALLCITYTALVIGAAWWISRKLGNAGEDTSCDDPYLNGLAGKCEATTGDVRGGRELLNGSRLYDVRTRHGEGL